MIGPQLPPNFHSSENTEDVEGQRDQNGSGQGSNTSVPKDSNIEVRRGWRG